MYIYVYIYIYREREIHTYTSEEAGTSSQGEAPNVAYSYCCLYIVDYNNIDNSMILIL